MFRSSRRYRSFVVLSVIVGLIFLQFLRSHGWSADSSVAKPKIPPARKVNLDSTPDHLSPPEVKPPIDAPIKSSNDKGLSDKETTKQKELVDDAQWISEKIQKPATPPKVEDSEEVDSPSMSELNSKMSGDNSQQHKDTGKLDTIAKKPQGQKPSSNNARPQEHWRKSPEHFPVPDSEIIILPAGQPKKLPKLQAAEKDETSTERAMRSRRLAAVKGEFEHAWSGYVAFAMGHDEVKPVSGGYRDPFAGWGATLVDTLDTLWIMGLKNEFAAALEEVGKIDFTTSTRRDIPVFETVIRYLGGLIGAYDISGQKYSILLDKAVELAEVLMGAFDTPNRMPITYYNWAPVSVAQPQRAGTRVVLAEVGSLSMEFTRLAQLTKEHKYYDAIARITNELEIMQMNTRLPGMWPLAIDASGCAKGSITLPQLSSFSREPELIGHKDEDSLKDTKPLHASTSLQEDLPISKNIEKRESGLDADAEPADYAAESKTTTASLNSNPFPKSDCVKQGLASPQRATSDRFGLGGESDSTYEYLPKEYLLLGGLNDQYRSLYEASMEPVRDKLLFRPMLPDRRDIRFVANVRVRGTPQQIEDIEYIYEGTHLTCFAGGMFAVGAKIFGLVGDMDIAAKLTDGCVWAYESTNTGIMPEGIEVLPCENPLSCSWNETRYLDEMDPQEASRIRQEEEWYERQLQSAKETYESSHQSTTNIVNPVLNAEDSESISDRKPSRKGTPADIVKRDTSSNDYDEHAHLSTSREPVVADEDVPRSRLDMNVPDFKPPPRPKILSHKEFVQKRLEEERLPLGYTKIQSRKYILRPEAIESVFVMYRLTGDEIWREKGWKMFESIVRYCRADRAHSAISDVTSSAPELLDEMESFWLAETLKYFYLLFSDSSVVSLDEYVLNTEAHPFKRPQW